MKKRILFMIVVVAILLCMAGTSMAVTYSYARTFTSTAIYGKTGYVGSSGHVIDDNTRCYFITGGSEYTIGYTSKGMMNHVLSNEGDLQLGVWDQFSAAYVPSGGYKKHHYYYHGIANNGALGFKNSDAPGYSCGVSGKLTITSS